MTARSGSGPIDPLAQLTEEHFELLDLSARIRRRLAAGDRSEAWELLASLADVLISHMSWEERGVFRALTEEGEYAESITELEQEHRALDEELSELALDAPDFDARVTAVLDHVNLLVDKEGLGIFPVCTVTLGSEGWATVDRAQREAGG